MERLGRLKGLAALRFTVRAIQRTTEMICRDAPSAVQEERIDMLLVDQTEPAGGTVAEHLGIPFVTLCNALAINREPQVPPPFSAWAYSEGILPRIRNRLGYAASDLLTKPIEKTLQTYRREWGLPRYSNPEQSFSTLAQISQIPSDFDFPRKHLPQSFHYAGPFRYPARQEVGFPWERLNGRPLVYASLGTLQGANEAIFRCFGEACRGLDVQLVISHGNRLTKDEADRLAELALVVNYAPQLALLERARLTITHAGLNTVMDSLSCGVPMAAIPLTFEQPGIAERIRWTGTGKVLGLRDLTAAHLRAVVAQLLADGGYAQRAATLAQAIRRGGGVARAADIIEQVFRSGRPVLRER
jgi:MGT family glycosyltransferase